MWNERDPRRELRGHEVAMGRAGSEVVVLDDRVIEAAARAQPGHTNINVTKSSRLHIGPKFVSVTQNVDNTEVVKGRILGLELVSPQNSKRLRCSIAVFVCWAFVVASGLTFFIFHFALAKQAKRLDLDLPLPRYLWDIAKSTTRAERLSCAAALIVLSVCIVLIVYFTVIAKKTANSVDDVAPHEWYITREMWLAPDFIDLDDVTEYEPLKLVIVAHTVSPECTLFMNCAAELRNLQSYYIEKYGYDLPYNFLIGNEGRVYEGRGWTTVGAHTRGYNGCTLGLAFIGDYREGLPSYSKVTELQLLRANMLLEEGVKLGHLVKNYHVLGAKDVQSSLSPGTNLYRAIQQWPSYDHDNFYKGKSCEDIYIDRNQTSVVAQTAELRSSFENSTAPHEWYITREMWLAPDFVDQDNVTEYEPLKLVIVAHTVSSECSLFMNCAAELRNLQNYYFKQHGHDLPYNFLIGNDGRVYEGRGWTRAGAHTRGYNGCTLGLAFIGDYREDLPSYSKVTELQLLRANMLLEEGVKLGHLVKNYHVLGTKDVEISISPGDNLYKAIQLWPNYDHDNFYKGKTCEEIYHDRNQTSVVGQTFKPPSSFRNQTDNQSLNT